MGFAIFAIIIVAVVIVFLILGSVKNPLDNEMGKLQNWLDRNNFKITSSVRSVLIDENTKRWAVYKSEQSPVYDFKDIVKVELDENGNKYVSQNGVLRAVVGSAVFGGVGAIVGATTATKSHTINSLNVIVYTSRISDPVITIPLIISPVSDSSALYSRNKADAIKLMGMLNAIAFQNEPAKAENVSAISNADELAKYKKLLDEGAISEEEYKEVKSKILNSIN
jgi:uncharacterized membrane protein